MTVRSITGLEARQSAGLELAQCPVFRQRQVGNPLQRSPFCPLPSQAPTSQAPTSRDFIGTLKPLFFFPLGSFSVTSAPSQGTGFECLCMCEREERRGGRREKRREEKAEQTGHTHTRAFGICKRNRDGSYTTLRIFSGGKKTVADSRGRAGKLQLLVLNFQACYLDCKEC